MGFLRLDPMMIKLIITVLLATFLPAKGIFVDIFDYLTTAAIALLFFYARCQAVAGKDHRRQQPLATAPVDYVQHLCALSDPRPADRLVASG
ncbi:bile acid:sodium symporter [Pantoea tagorei]